MGSFLPYVSREWRLSKLFNISIVIILLLFLLSLLLIILLLLLLSLSSFDIIISNTSVFLGPFTIQIYIILGSGNHAY